MSSEKRPTVTSAESSLESSRLEALERYDILGTAPEKAFERITALASKIFAVPIALITFIDKDNLWFKSCYGMDVRRMDRQVSFCTYTILSDEVMVVPDMLRDSRFAWNPLVTGEAHVRFYAGAPLRASNGHNLGTLCLIDTEPRESFGEVQQGMLADLAAMVVDELELRNASRALQVSETKLHTVIETISDAIYIKDLEGRYILINPAGADTVGRSVEDVLGKRDADLFSADEAAQILSVDHHLVTTGIPVTYERATGAATTPKIHLTSKYPYHTHDGKLVGLVGISRDVTASRRAEQALTDSETRYRIVAETASDAIITIDQDSRILYANGAVGKIFGYEQAELHSHDLTLLMPDYLRHLHEAALERYVVTGVRHMHWEAIEIPALHKNGTEIPMEVSFGEHHENGKRLFTGIMRDVTERKKAETALAESEARFRQLAERINDVFWVSDLQAGGRMLYISPAFETVWGHSLESLHKHPKLFFEGIHPDDRAKVATAFDNSVRSKGQQKHVEYRVVQPEGDVRWIRDRAFPVADDHGEVYRVVGVAEDITERKHIQEELTKLTQELEQRVGLRTAELAEANAQLLHDAFHDKLTGLANRALFLDRLGQAVERYQRRADGGFGVLYLDSDRFKVVNDSLGHTTGDQLLIELAERLKSCVRPGDTVARLGGDEFVILLEDAALAEEATQVAERIQYEVRKPFMIDNRVIHTSVSIGIVMSSTCHENAQGILRDADIAMYHAKALGKARYQVFTETMHDHAVSLMALENDLRGAIERDELRVYYQPIKSITGGQLTGFEALVRWEHQTLGTVLPTTFIPIAEETGLIIELDRWVLHAACRQLKNWQQRFPFIPPLTINVNLSSRQFLEADLVDFVGGVLEETAIRPEHLKLEVTESVLMQHLEAVTVAFRRLKALGVKLYVDDFGTGYSSLSYLQRFPVDTLKIDRSFIHNMATSPESAELVRTIIAMAQALNLSVVAEGIETASQLAQLEALGCSYGQGYFFAKLLEVSEATSLLHAAKTAQQVSLLEVSNESGRLAVP